MAQQIEPTHLKRSTLLATIMALLFLTVGADATSATPRGEVMLDKSFSVSAGEKLTVDLSDANVRIETGRSDVVEVQVYLYSKKMDRARKRYDELNIRAEKASSGVVLKDERPHNWSWNWGNMGGFSVTALISLPEEFDVDIETSDGDVSLERLRGQAVLNSSDGDIEVGTLIGDLSLETSDGDIRLDSIRGATRAVTSDGDLRIDAIEGDDVYIKTSDGDVRIGRIEADAIELYTSDGDFDCKELSAREIVVKGSDGDLDLGVVSGALEAKTSDGWIRFEVGDLGDSQVETHDGDIYITAPSSFGADLDFRAEHVEIDDQKRFDGRWSRHSVRGEFNGGGPMLRASSGDGDIELKTRK